VPDTPPRDDRSAAGVDLASLYREVFAAAPDGILLLDPDTQRALDFNDAACAHLGYTREEFRRLRISDYDARETAADVVEHVRDTLRVGETEFDTVHRTKSGALRDVHVWAKAIQHGSRTVLLSIFRDITAQRQAEHALRENIAFLAESQRLAHVGHWILDLETGTLALSDELYRIFGASPDTFAPSVDALLTLIHPDDRTGTQRWIDALRAGAAPGLLEFRVVRPDGSVRVVEADGELQADAQGRPARMVGTARDMTERRQLDESQRLQSAALRAAANAIVITDREGRIEWVNPAFSQLTGYSFEDAIGRNPRDLVRSGHHTPDFFAEFWQTILAGRPWRGEMVNRRKDGTLYEEDQSVTPIVDRTGAVSHFVAVKQDVSERRRLEAQYRQAQRMEVVGQLASGIAHDFNNLLTVINGLSDLLLQQEPANSAIEGDLQEIRRAGERAATLTRQLLAFSRQQVQTLEVLDLNALVAGIERLLRRLVGEDVHLDVVPAQGLQPVKADPGQLEQVITNLAVNARDAMPSGGRLAIETQNAWVDEAWAREHGVTCSPGPYVVLVVSDSGIGMDEATRARIFDPFFTTKGPGKGTGLGLSTVYGIVKQTGGFIWVQSTPGQGTTFEIYLPAVNETPSTAEPAPVEGGLSGTETVLLVEDNDELRAWTRRVLESAGYSVRVAADANEAARRFFEQAGLVDLLLTDVVMPGKNGRHLAEELTTGHPGLRVLYMSGYTNDTVVRHGVLEGTMSFLGKPFSASTLLHAVRRTLDT
jgi:two-component system, cell cycle sensor histidine kinase and response regulator CckA